MYALALRYRLREASPDSYQALNDAVAADVAASAELLSASWLTDGTPGRYCNVYLFQSRIACERFRNGPVVAQFEAHTNVLELAATTYPLPDAGAAADPSVQPRGRETAARPS